MLHHNPQTTLIEISPDKTTILVEMIVDEESIKHGEMFNLIDQM